MNQKTWLQAIRKQKILSTSRCRKISAQMQGQNSLRRMKLTLSLVYYKAAAALLGSVYRVVWSAQLLVTSITVVHTPFTTMKSIVKSL